MTEKFYQPSRETTSEKSPTEFQEIGEYKVTTLTKEMAHKYLDKITQMADLIPQVDYNPEDILKESKGERMMLGKWEHSLIVFDKNNPIGILIAYERSAENNDLYPQNSIYLSELAVDKDYQGQGIAQKLLDIFIQRTTDFLHLEGPLVFSVQTNSAEWNNHVQRLYESRGFKKIAEKKYDNRTDNVYSRIIDENQ